MSTKPTSQGDLPTKTDQVRPDLGGDKPTSTASTDSTSHAATTPVESKAGKQKASSAVDAAPHPAKEAKHPAPKPSDPDSMSAAIQNVQQQAEKADREQAKEASTVDLGDAGSLKIHSLGQRHFGAGGAEQAVTVEVADGRFVTLHGIPADLLK